MSKKSQESAFGFDAPEESPGFLLWQTTVTWQRHIKVALDPFDISHAQFVILAVSRWFEEHNEPPTQVTIARLSRLDKMTVSKSLRKLSDLALIKRSENKEDTRAKSVSLTKKGRALAQKLIPIVEAVDARFFNTLSKADSQALLKLLNRLVLSPK
ncbi:MAG: MarR family transcriptional regulator [Verrucomicrobia bacterium CG_4_10_14_3_um_filter_43_23]|nr:MAG: hypothetical protein AUJ82_00540 [Verrucomicrobia bacterium CG1_02_43_26]PIP59240.1 MAG: MarR family transcriptional regulator [Verrucomicrobia bacterium CG22_combo_CG10-13_8_21_14_all_43_17]PIX58576.1 MAG: MarR family transcriptional regulator [Verrucomicrobia bacterium CG_4_10_14_3_um_filter_43_23]PIY61028.1 MAG: MarR family transcriptional regulator [Verrucomicrobia bacterium CG_4_10_14_0_8_um_filter_43_34]PJA43869.1 MAG: MarR family transcriptional regulator [Verrucomicrobia bacteri